MYVTATASADEGRGCGGSQSNWPQLENVAYFVFLGGNIIRLYKLALSDQAQDTATVSFQYSVKIFSRPALAGGRPILLHPPCAWSGYEPVLTVNVFRIYTQEIIQSKSGCMKYFGGRAVLRFRPVGS